MSLNSLGCDNEKVELRFLSRFFWVVLHNEFGVESRRRATYILMGE